jgi:Exopolysaccharide biosynthesis protein YbjH
MFFRILVFIFAASFLIAQSYDNDVTSLFEDLERVSCIDDEINDDLPLIFNYQSQIGYFTMPSARMSKAGVFAFSFAYLPPYRLYNLLFQYFDHLEITGNYWLFHGIEDSALGPKFGTFCDRAANVKLALLQKQDGLPMLPEFAIGVNDFIGSMRFSSFYIVATQTFLEYNIEATLGWGNGRINGFFGALALSPFRKVKSRFFKNLTFILEYDANDYEHHRYEHQKGKNVKYPINFGINYKFLKFFEINASTIRGKKIAASAMFKYNIGTTEGLFPKTNDPLPFKAPLNIEPIGIIRSQKEVAQEFAYAFQEQGFDLYSVYRTVNFKKKDILWMKVINVRYRIENDVRCRILHVLSALSPENIDEIIVVIEADGVLVHQYCFSSFELNLYREKKICDKEVAVISHYKEVTKIPCKYDSIELYRRRKKIWQFTFRPTFRTYWGSSTGKFKYDVGLVAGPQGYLFGQFYYDMQFNYIINSSTSDIGDKDKLNPSQIINVRSDSIKYVQGNTFKVNRAYLQRSCNLGHGWFARGSVGYFELAYAGFAGEFLYYPVKANWAVGFQAATVWKRNYEGIFFQKKIRKLQGTKPTFIDFIGVQYFLDLYYDYKPLNVDLRFSFGQFLAKDKGVRMDLARTFPSGLRIGGWYTFTTAKDFVNRKRYYDKGVFFSLPLDIFMPKSSRTRIGYAMAAWLRDIGAVAETGKQLYQTIYFERYNQRPLFY